MSFFRPHRISAVLLVAMVLGLAVWSRLAIAQEKKVVKNELRKQMEQIDDAVKKLKRTVRTADLDKQSLELIAKVQQSAIACKSMVPSKAASLPEAQREKFITAYRTGMAAFLSDTCQLEIAILSGDHEKAHEFYTKLKDDEDKGHDQFMPDEDKDAATK